MRATVEERGGGWRKRSKGHDRLEMAESRSHLERRRKSLERSERKFVRQLTGYVSASVAGRGGKFVFCPECCSTFHPDRIPPSSPAWRTNSGKECTHALIRKYHGTDTTPRSVALPASRPALALQWCLMADAEIQYISDDRGETTAVIVPISLWRDIESERETRYLLKSERMRRRLLDAKSRDEGVPLEDAVQQLKL